MSSDKHNTKPVLSNGIDISFQPALIEFNTHDKEEESFEKRNAVPMSLSWRDLTFLVPDKAKKREKHNTSRALKNKAEKTILSGISGSVGSGQILAVIGSSGAGKTSLLNLLAGRITTNKGARATGSVLVNGQPRDYASFRSQSAYVLQDDDMFAQLTVREQVRYAASLRLPSSMSVRKKTERVDRIIQELGLAKVSDSRIGDSLLRGISGGERKRVSIATELVTDPSLLFLDEPTTGLDSFNALNDMQSLRKLASNGRTIVCTIHQPRSAIFALFDQLLVLSEGRTMYQGPASEAVPYFSSLGFNAPEQFNPADFFIDLLSVDPRSSEKESVTKLRIHYVGDKYDAALAPDHIKAEDPEAASDLKKLPYTSKQFQNSWLKELVILSDRSVKLVLRSNIANLILFFQTLVFSVILGLLWFGNGRKTDIKSQRSLSGILFFIAINQSFGAAFGVIFQFPLERSIVTRERASNMYRTSSYFLSKTVTDMAKTFTFNMMFALIVYWMVGLRADVLVFFQFVLVLFTLSTFSESVALAISVLTGDPQASSSLVPVVVILCVLCMFHSAASLHASCWFVSNHCVLFKC